jgi:hypothetical protein
LELEKLSFKRSKELDFLGPFSPFFYPTAWILFGIGVCSFFTLGRSSGLFKGLWEDEVHYHYALFYSANFLELRHDVYWLYRPLLDFLVRKYIWFSKFGLAVNERNLSLVSLIYSTIHLLLWCFVPWTANKWLRMCAVLLLAYCAVETQYSTEAQSYSFISLASTFSFFCCAAAVRLWERRRGILAAMVWLVGMTVCLNAHFFSWPMVLVLVGVSMQYALNPDRPRSTSIVFMALSFPALVAFSVWLNWPSLYFLLSEPPKANALWSWQWGSSWALLCQTGSWFDMPFWLFVGVALPGFWHPSRLKRYLWFAAVVTIFPVKFLVLLLIQGISSYSIGDRYLIMFLGPSLFALALGADSLLWLIGAGVSMRSYRPFFNATFFIAVLISSFPKIYSGFKTAPIDVKNLFEKPANGSNEFLFFEKLKDFKEPLLLLSDHCYGSDAPKFYHEFIGKPSVVPWEVLNTNGYCETSLADLRFKSMQFFRLNPNRGELVFWYDWDPDRALIACPPQTLWAEKEPAWPCAGILRRKAGEQYLRKAIQALGL